MDLQTLDIIKKTDIRRLRKEIKIRQTGWGTWDHRNDRW